MGRKEMSPTDSQVEDLLGPLPVELFREFYSRPSWRRKPTGSLSLGGYILTCPLSVFLSAF